MTGNDFDAMLFMSRQTRAYRHGHGAPCPYAIGLKSAEDRGGQNSSIVDERCGRYGGQVAASAAIHSVGGVRLRRGWRVLRHHLRLSAGVPVWDRGGWRDAPEYSRGRGRTRMATDSGASAQHSIGRFCRHAQSFSRCVIYRATGFEGRQIDAGTARRAPTTRFHRKWNASKSDGFEDAWAA